MTRCSSLPVLSFDTTDEERVRFAAGDAVPEAFAALAADVEASLKASPHACIVRGTGVGASSDALSQSIAHRFSALIGEVSDSNRFSEASGRFVDAIAPTQPQSPDPTFSMGRCEAHADESSKPDPEDVVALWCVRPASDGGDSLLWPTESLRETLAATKRGRSATAVLEEPEFLFGGKLRNPPRVLRAPVLFGPDGIRFRLGSMEDAREHLNSPFPQRQREAIGSLIDAIDTTPPLRYRLSEGEALISMNRKGLHARSDFRDTSRVLLRTRCYAPHLSNSDLDHAGWLS